MAAYSHWTQVPQDGKWTARWPNFSPQEIACRGTGALVVDEEAMDALQALRNMMGHPLIVVSAYRSPSHNKAVGGAENSQHLRGRAFDISVANTDPHILIRAARKAGFRGIGTYPRQGFVHVDVGPERTWGDPFPPRVNRFAPEPEPAPVMATGTAQAAVRGAAGIVAALAASAPSLVDVAQHPLASVVPWVGSGLAVLALVALLLAVFRRRKQEVRDD
jgi:hypothetical protein